MSFDETALIQYLPYTEDELLAGDAENLKSVFDMGKEAISELVGFKIDYDKSAKARSLVLDWCRYRLSQATEYFEPNFRHEINEVRYGAPEDAP